LREPDAWLAVTHPPLGVQRRSERNPLSDSVCQDIVRDDERGQGVGLMLPGLPGHRRLLKLGQVPGDPAGTYFEPLQ